VYIQSARNSHRHNRRYYFHLQGWNSVLWLFKAGNHYQTNGVLYSNLEKTICMSHHKKYALDSNLCDLKVSFPFEFFRSPYTAVSKFVSIHTPIINSFSFTCSFYINQFQLPKISIDWNSVSSVIIRKSCQFLISWNYVTYEIRSQYQYNVGLGCYAM
jgi:hypothetical protein